ncbi:AfsR/SARP family transcriptional regulator [Paenibacillus methanolicus]|uniref:DNA-binding SARP family transcriptional activator n=1 Tax=Paenibacillus methanolicus TaxID=582686 RepID=A0A5S5C8V8_9BACL|nr:BTAD domain-containing putative transcriptional regulator [Paenibacillus methanolicus]TYP75774.1 DNA-binding SARP family transcriptional activator [Paenibacillus methanolicus]
MTIERGEQMMEHNGRLSQNTDAWTDSVLSLERAILDGRRVTADMLAVIPASIRNSSPLLLQAECEEGLLQGRLGDAKRLIESALRAFAAQANEQAMLTLMGMLGLLYQQVGDRSDSRHVLDFLRTEWAHSGQACSGFVPWALARALAGGGLDEQGGLTTPEELFLAAAHRFREEGKPLWAAIVMLERLLYDPQRDALVNPAWRLLLQWLGRSLDDTSLGQALKETLNAGGKPKDETIELLPARYVYLVNAICFGRANRRPPRSLDDDIEVQFYAAAAELRRGVQRGDDSRARELWQALEGYAALVSSPEMKRRLIELEELRKQTVREETAEPAITVRPAAEAVPNLTEPEPASVTADRRWRVQLIDGLRFSSADGQVAEPVWKRRKAGELLVYLLLQPAYKANREQVLERVFGEGETAKQSNQLYVTLHDLRHTLREMGMSDPVYVKRGVIGLDEQIIEHVDAEAYMTLSRVGDQLWNDDREAACRLYEEALPLYGQLATELPNVEWLERTREQMLDRQTNMLKRLAIYYTELRDEVKAEQALSEWIALRPKQEEAYEAMIRHCLAKSHRAEAIGWYKRLERMYEEEFGSEPLEETKRLLWN